MSLSVHKTCQWLKFIFIIIKKSDIECSNDNEKIMILIIVG